MIIIFAYSEKQWPLFHCRVFLKFERKVMAIISFAQKAVQIKAGNVGYFW